MRDVGNWIGELTTTTGTGPITLGGPLTSAFSSFSSVGITSVEYSIIDGDDREAGLGTIAGGILTRNTIHSTIVNGVYSGNSPGPISLSGLAQVHSAFSRVAFDELQTALVKLLTIETNAKDDQIAVEVPFSPVGNITSVDVQAAIVEVEALIGFGVVDITLNYNWTGTHTYTVRTTVNGNVVYDAGNIHEAVIPINVQTGTAYVAVLSDAGSLVTMNNAAANTFTVPPNSSVAYPIGTTLIIRQKGAGQTTIVEGSGVTVVPAVSKGLIISEQGEWASLIKEGTDAWSAAGGLKA